MPKLQRRRASRRNASRESGLSAARSGCPATTGQDVAKSLHIDASILRTVHGACRETARSQGPADYACPQQSRHQCLGRLPAVAPRSPFLKSKGDHRRGRDPRKAVEVLGARAPHTPMVRPAHYHPAVDAVADVCAGSPGSGPGQEVTSRSNRPDPRNNGPDGYARAPTPLARGDRRLVSAPAFVHISIVVSLTILWCLWPTPKPFRVNGPQRITSRVDIPVCAIPLRVLLHEPPHLRPVVPRAELEEAAGIGDVSPCTSEPVRVGCCAPRGPASPERIQRVDVGLYGPT